MMDVCAEEMKKMKVSYKQEELHNPASMIQKVYYDRHEELESITQERVTMKSTSISKCCIIEGLESFERKLYGEAVDWYTKSMAFDPADGGEEIVNVYMYRSIANFSEGRFIDCLLDINRALKRMCSLESTRIHLRPLNDLKTLCLVKLRASEQYAKYEGDETDPIDAMNADDDQADKEFNDRCNFKNPLIPRTSSKIKLEYDDGKWGRHIVATEDIEPGEILSSQECFASELNPALWFQYCSYCHTECRALIPCSSCSSEMYCSTKCQQRAKKLYHDMECKVIAHMTKKPAIRVVRGPPSDSELLTSLILNAQRTLLIGTKKGIGLKNLMEKLDMSEIFAENVDSKNEPFVDEYLAILRMNRMFQTQYLTENLITWILHAVVALRHAGYFGEADENSARNETKKDSLNKMEIFTAMLMMNHVLTLPFNYSFKFTHFIGQSLYEESAESILVAMGVESLFNYINHSCLPNINSIIRKRERVIFAVRIIKKGEQIFDSYCGIFTDRSLQDRQSFLMKKYGFYCLCFACLYNWPLADIADSEEKTFLKGCKEGTIRPQPKLRYKPEHYVSIKCSFLDSALEFDKLLSKICKKPQLYNTVQTKCEILQALLQIRKCFDNDGVPAIKLTKPLMLVMECEKNITVLMKLLFEKSSGRWFRMEVVDVIGRLHNFSIWLDSYFHNFFSLHGEEYSNINLSV